MNKSMVLALGLVMVSGAQAATVNCSSPVTSVNFSVDSKATSNEVILGEVRVYTSYPDSDERVLLVEDSMTADQTDREAAYLDVWRFHSTLSESAFTLDLPRAALSENAPAKYEAKLRAFETVETLSCTVSK